MPHHRGHVVRMQFMEYDRLELLRPDFLHTYIGNGNVRIPDVDVGVLGERNDQHGL
jgi:hypothetical protein